MPKIKTKSSAKKRFKVTGKGQVRSKQAYTRHMMMNKSKKMKRKARGLQNLCAADAKSVLKNWLPYARKQKGSNQTSIEGES